MVTLASLAFTVHGTSLYMGVWRIETENQVEPNIKLCIEQYINNQIVGFPMWGKGGKKKHG